MEASNQVFYGTVIWFSGKSGYGFVQQTNGQPDIFVHYSDIACEGFKTLQKDQKVSYEIGLNKHGKPKAVNVKIIK